MSYDLDITAATRVLDTVESIFEPGTSLAILMYAADRVGAAAVELMPGSSNRTPYPPQTNNPLPLYYDRMTAPVYRYRTKNGKRYKTDEVVKPPTPYKSKFKSDAQQRYVMMLASKGLLPYKRTGQLGKSFTHSKPVALSTAIVEVSVGTNLTYAPYVVGLGRQSHYHAGNWPLLEDALANGVAFLEETALTSILGELRRRIRNER